MDNSYKIEILHGVNAISFCCICNKEFINPNFERLALESVEDKDTYGIFVKKRNGDKVLTSLIFTIYNEECEIILLCSNEKGPRIGVTTKTMNYFLKLLKKTKPEVIKIKLKIAKENLNNRAKQFYKKFGFKKLGDTNIYELNLK